MRLLAKAVGCLFVPVGSAKGSGGGVSMGSRVDSVLVFVGVRSIDVLRGGAVVSSSIFVRLGMCAKVGGLLVVLGAKSGVTVREVVRGLGCVVVFQVAIALRSQVMSARGVVMRTN
jgi:hypothetical protein